MRLYENAKRDQWNATERLDWSIDVDPAKGLLPDAGIGIFGTPIWQKLTPREIEQLRHEAVTWQLCQFLHGEQGALLATAQIVDSVPWYEGKQYGATQVMDEARHVEVYRRFIQEKLGHEYPVNRGAEEAARPDPRRLALGHEVPRHADHRRGPGARRLRHDPRHHVEPAAARSHGRRDGGRVAPRGLRRALAARVLRGPLRGRAQRARGVRLRGLRADARPHLEPRGLGDDGPRRRRLHRGLRPVAAGAAVPLPAVLEDRAQRQEPRACSRPASASASRSSASSSTSTTRPRTSITTSRSSGACARASCRRRHSRRLARRASLRASLRLPLAREFRARIRRSRQRCAPSAPEEDPPWPIRSCPTPGSRRPSASTARSTRRCPTPSRTSS